MVKAWILGGLLTLSSAGCQVSGIPFARDYPPLTEDSKALLEENVLLEEELNMGVVEDVSQYPECDGSDGDCMPPTPFTGTTQEYLNRFFDFVMDDYKAKGYSMRGKGDLEFIIVSPKGMDDHCSGASACYKNEQNIIVLPDDRTIMGLVGGKVNHEMGHFFYHGDNEFPAQSHEMYWPIKAYQFSKPIGSLMSWYAIPPLPQDAISDLTPGSAMYNKGQLFGIYYLGKNSGDIEKSMYNITHKLLLAQTETLLYDDVLNSQKYKDMNTTEIYFQLWDELLNNENFFEELTSDTGHLSGSDASELIDFLKMINYTRYLEIFNDDEGKIDGLLQNMIEFEGNGGYTNPYFRAKVVEGLTEGLAPQGDELRAIVRKESALNHTVSEESLNAYHSFNKWMIDMNSAYPCSEPNPYSCPQEMREMRFNHIYAYFRMETDLFIFNQAHHEMAVEATNYAIDFLERFYSGTDIMNEEFAPLKVSQKETDNFVPYIAYLPAKYALDYDRELARKLFIAAVSVECKKGNHGPISESCVGMQDTARAFLKSNWGILY
ncbi:MAG: hypothetical protein ABIB71_01295 [Candidatus Woesearchaeota archaeon]